MMSHNRGRTVRGVREHVARDARQRPRSGAALGLGSEAESVEKISSISSKWLMAKTALCHFRLLCDRSEDSSPSKYHARACLRTYASSLRESTHRPPGRSVYSLGDTAPLRNDHYTIVNNNCNDNCANIMLTHPRACRSDARQQTAS